MCVHGVCKYSTFALVSGLEFSVEKAGEFMTPTTPEVFERLPKCTHLAARLSQLHESCEDLVRDNNHLTIKFMRACFGRLGLPKTFFDSSLNMKLHLEVHGVIGRMCAFITPEVQKLHSQLYCSLPVNLEDPKP